MNMALRLAYSVAKTVDPLVRTNVIICHGLLGSKQNWNSVSHVLSKNGCGSIYTLDMRNHGHSPRSDDMTYTAMAADIGKFIDDMKLKNVCAVGHSMGGKAVVCAALLQPDKIDRLVVLDSSPAYISKIQSIIPQLSVMLNTNLHQVERECDGTLSGMRRYLMNKWKEEVPDQSVRAFLLMNLDQIQDEFFWRANLKALQSHWHNIVGFPSELHDHSYQGPTLFMASGKSGYIKSDDVPAIRKYFPRARFLRLPNAGHWLHVDAPQTVIALLSAFIQGKDENLLIAAVTK
ncbi:unnamed protein product [Calicophoron daubneyi]|uniref:sn-1-specific diacylglycerol lipase ABHD11 n=1 Tax=Calicophoron daubneyi TaxID=300641 RepID=A0AAV2TV66_CALDB